MRETTKSCHPERSAKDLIRTNKMYHGKILRHFVPQNDSALFPILVKTDSLFYLGCRLLAVFKPAHQFINT